MTIVNPVVLRMTGGLRRDFLQFVTIANDRGRRNRGKPGFPPLGTILALTIREPVFSSPRRGGKAGGGDPMVSAALRGVVALTAALVVASPAWAQLGVVSSWLRNVPQPSALGVFLIAVAGVFVGLFASRKRREP